MAVFFLLMAGGACAAQDIQEGKPVPPLSATLLNGARFSIAEQSGKVVIVNFWATWCAPCWAEMPALEAYYKKHRSQGLEIIAISIDDPGDESKVRAVMKQYTFPAAMMHDAKVESFGSISRVPLTFVVDHRGIVRRNGWRARPAGIDMPTLEWSVTPYLPGPPARSGLAP